MIYKGYTGVLEVDEESGELFGTVAGLNDVVTFVGSTIEEARESFERSVDFYLERCAATGKEPERPFSGRLVVRVSPEIHARLGRLAGEQNTSAEDLASRMIVLGVAERPHVVMGEPGEGRSDGRRDRTA